MRVLRDSNRVLAHWVYNQEEWHSYRRWERRRRGWWAFITGRHRHLQVAEVPEVIISGSQVRMNGLTESFQNEKCRLKRTHLRESDSLHILEIYFQRENRRLQVIYLPVPRGRLREAMEVQECLSGMAVY